MKNIFLLKYIKNSFSFGKDSFYHYFNCFYKKKNYLFINFHNFKIFNINFVKLFNLYLYVKKLKKKTNELILRKIRISFLKNYKNTFIIKNNHLFDKIEYFLLKILKKKKLKINNYWYFKNIFFIKPYINIFIKKNFCLIDKSNKFIKIERNFIRCLICNFLK